MPVFTSSNPEECKEIECAVCLEPWDGPVELDPCGHVFCRGCAQTLDKCPDCRQKIRGRKEPNRILTNLANAVQMRCETCRWLGTRESSRTHRCAEGAPPPPPPPPPSAPTHSPPQQHHHQQRQPAQQQRPYHAPAATPAPTNDQPWHAYGLDQDEYDHIFAVFMTFDTDGSGELDRGELTTLCRWLNYAHSPADVDAMFRAMDADGSGALSMHEFCSWISTHRPDPQALYGLSPLEYNEVLFQFHTYDRDQNGSLDMEEFVGLAVRQGYANDANSARQLFRAVDTDGGGTVDLHELLTFRAQRTGHHPTPGGPQGSYPQQQQQQQQQWQQQQQQWQQEYPAPAPYGERPRYDGAHSAPQARWEAQGPPNPSPWAAPPQQPPQYAYPPQQQHQQQQQYQQQQQPGQYYPPSQGSQYDPARPYPNAQQPPPPQQQHSASSARRKNDKKGDCVVM